MSNFNKVILLGRLTRDPELRYTPQGTPVTDIGLAVNREFGTGAERKKDTTFVDITFWRRQAEVLCQYLNKGSPIFIEGRLVTDSWEGQDGKRRSRLKVVGDNFQFVGGGGGGERRSFSGEEGAGYSAPPDSHDASGAGYDAPSGVTAGDAGNGHGEPNDGIMGIDDKDIPF